MCGTPQPDIRSSRTAIQNETLRVKTVREQFIDFDELQTLLWSTATGLTAPEDARLRELLQNAEGRVELARFTVESDRVFAEVTGALDAVESAVNAALRSAAGNA